MNRKPGPFPFVHSPIALLMLSLTVMGSPAYAESDEAPAVLQFARQYQQQQIDFPRYTPSKKAPKPKRKTLPNPKKPVPVSVVNKTPMTEPDRLQLVQLQSSISQKEQAIAAQNLTIQKLEKQLSVLHLAAQKASVSPVVSAHDVQMVQKMVESLYRTFTLRPAPEALAENLKQANQQAARARQAESVLQEQQKDLKLQLGKLQNQLTVLKNDRSQMTGERESSLSAQLEKQNTLNHQLESDLTANRQKVLQTSDRVYQLESSIRKLESENKQYADDNKQLLLQISGHSNASETLASVKNQQSKLQDELATRQQQLTHLQNEKQQMQQQLAAAPTPAQLADSQNKVKALQIKLDENVQQLQKQERSASEQVKSSSEVLIAEKKLAEDKIKALQVKLDASQTQQAAIQSEKQQLQQKLQSNLLSKEENSAAIAGQIKALQDKLATAQLQQTAMQADKEKLQQQLDHAPTPAQLADSQLKIKALQGQLDNALLLQSKEGVTSEDAKVSDPIITADYKAAEDKVKELQQKLDATQAQLTEAAKQSAAPKVKGTPEMNSETLKKKATREAYAVGISLGTEILQIQAENRNWASTDSDKPSVLAGIIDAFQGKEKLAPDELHKALMNISERVKSGREKYMGDLDKSTKKFIANFTKQKNVKKSDSGFWYRVGYVGDVPIPAGATIDVVVKESLANGMIIEDMDAKGIVLTQPISAFPPVFREALSRLKNHGSITIVVPPSLAYGDKGYPPKVPPNATMVYDLRVSDIYPEQSKK
ncbi:FKBP-type peptidyl-prolyl cis-trans isomerase N-terminal domain-containing protein [Erwinia sp. JUb26]|uniref:FKBP-type peptidyl-prolyl cis-trans isomerase N-terminal domain-containing protein n=1 Tax=Erwinia sp. JUb26 TaxID=2485126 RepID=UPI000F47D231|nr:FKBP-type peptidyl-prolyl cis-trans isomerase N-terminal domain-containing protein [Erwinia sp. JUb26]ROR08822.1 FKBP-type peptidyl-prolyl cis-trans isomerase [Erwinia sp. JUb26]